MGVNPLGILFEQGLRRGTQEALSEGSQQFSKHGGAFARNIFQDAEVPVGVRSLFSDTGFSVPEVDTFTKAIDVEPSVRENLRTVITRAGEGNDEAFEVLSTMATDFSVTDMKTRNLLKSQAKIGNAKAKQWGKQMQIIDDARNPDVTGPRGRAVKNQVQTNFKAGSDYTSKSIMTRGGRLLSNRHHVIGLDDANNVWRWHRTGALATPNKPSPILQAREMVMGIKSGNHEQNLVDILDQITEPSREARKLQFNEMSGGLLEEGTVNDYFGGSKLRPRELDITGRKGFELQEAAGLETTHFDQLRQKDPTLTVERYMAENKSPITGTKYSEGQFPDIRVYKPGSNSTELLETISIKTAADHKNRLSKIFDVLDKHGYKTADARKNVTSKNLKIDSKLDIYGYDHKVVHSVIDTLKEKKGTALNEIATLGEEGIRDLPLDQAIKLDIRAIQEMETVLANVLIYRYGEVVKLFDEMYKGKGYKGLGEKFGELGAEAKNTFFKENINTIAVRGNVKKAITINNALKKPKWDPNVGETFGWNPQSLFATVDEIEEITKQFAEEGL